MATREKADAVIVGAGAAGAVFAAVLSRAGKHVVVLEQGPDWQLSDLISSDIWARRLRGSGPANRSSCCRPHERGPGDSERGTQNSCIGDSPCCTR